MNNQRMLTSTYKGVELQSFIDDEGVGYGKHNGRP